MNCKMAFIKRPWEIDSDIGRPVTLIRRGSFGEKIRMRSGGFSIFGIPVKGWLCEGSGELFPRFIADVCLHIIDGDESHEQSIEAMRLLTNIPQKEKA